MGEGYIRLHRDIIKWEWFQDDNMFRLFGFLLLKANYKDGKHQGKIVLRGQHLTSDETLANALNMSKWQIRRLLGKLQTTNEITRQSTRAGTCITITNYDTYQNDIEEPQQERQLDYNQNTIQTATKTQTNKKEKKYTDDSWEITGAKRIFDKMTSYNNKLKEPNYQEWAYHLDLLKRVDKHTEEEIYQVVKWLWTSDDNNADFWRKNILCTKTLRKQFARLFPLSKPPKKPNYGF